MISLINASAGTGKTRVLTMGYLMLTKAIHRTAIAATKEQEAIYTYMLKEFSKTNSICFFTHSNSSKDIIKSRLGKKASVYTFHGAGMSAIIRKHGFQQPVNNRTEKHIETITGKSLKAMEYTDKNEWYAIKRVLHYLKIEALSPLQSSLDYLIHKYPDLSSYSIPEDWLEPTQELYDMALIQDGEIDYADMLCLGKRSMVKPRYTLGLVDESQDMGKASYQLVTRMCNHVVFCGDKNQAIMAFAGASEEMYGSIASKSDAIFPMLETQRCPPHVCEAANAVRPGGIVEGPNKKEGTIATLPRPSSVNVNPNSKMPCLRKMWRAWPSGSR